MRNRRGRGQVTIAYALMAAVAALLVVVLAVRQISRATTTEVWTARTPLKAGQKIEKDHLVLARVAKDAVPAGAIKDPSKVLGRVLGSPVDEGDPITVQEFARTTPKVFLSDAPEVGRSVVTVRLKGGMLPVAQLKKADRLDIYAVTRSGESRLVAREAIFIGSLRSRGAAASKSALADALSGANPSAAPKHNGGAGGTAGVILSVAQQDVASLTAAEANSRLAFAVYGKSEPSYVPVAAKPVLAPPEVELILGSNREKVTVNR